MRQRHRVEPMSPSLPNATPTTRPFVLKGGALACTDAVTGSGGHVPRRRLGGWLTTYGQIVDGKVVPTVDRDNQVMDAARELGRIDWTSYIKGGKWNDSHRALLPDGRRSPIMEREARIQPVYVGVPTTLSFHDGTTDLSKAHAKVGFWSDGHLFDRSDPDSWRLYTDHEPTNEDLLRADAYWYLAKALSPTDARIGFSVHGTCNLSPCRKRIIAATIAEAALCTAPRHPDATVDLLAGGELDLLEVVSGAAAPRACERCRCPAGACMRLLKGMDADALAPAAPQDLEGATTATVDELREELVQRLIARGHATEDARRWVGNADLKQLFTGASS